MYRRILYVQFTDPAGYPPIEHSSLILAERGWDVLFLGTNSFIKMAFKLPVHSRVRMKRLRFVQAGLSQKLHYFIFFIWVLYWTLVWRPRWIYASDPLSSPVVWLVYKLTKVHVIYHEHDSPDPRQGQSRFMKLVLRCRSRLGRQAELCVLPQKTRMMEFLNTTQRRGPTYCVWNCPRLDEVIEVNQDRCQGIIIFYHGSINSARLPRELVIAACRFKGAVRIRIAGYETIGSVGYMQELNKLAAKEGVRDIIEFLGPMTPRKALFQSIARAHVGLSLMPRKFEDGNLGHMVGASNKPFDCMAAGLPLLVSDLPDWVSTFVDAGYARACDPEDPDSIESELRWYLEHPVERRVMGRMCRDRVRLDWNYETAFSAVVAHIEAA